MFTRREPKIDEQELTRIPGAEPQNRLDVWWWLVALVAGVIVLLSILQPDPYWRIILFVRDGIAITALITVVSFVFMIFVGMLGGLGRISKNKVVNLITTLYVELVRGVPLLVQLIWWYFAFPVVIQQIGRWTGISFMANYHSTLLFWLFGALYFVTALT
jgi:polar amino acid transport system permease protein